MLLTFDLFEMYKTACDPVLHTARMYPTTFRRRFIDIAGKIVSHAGIVVLKTTANCHANLAAMWSIQQEFDYTWA